MTKQTLLLLLACALFSGGLSAAPTASLADGRTGVIEFTSYTPAGHSALAQGTFDRKPVPISGKLSLPVGTGKVPAVVIGHTVGGIKPVLFNLWAQALSDAGYAVFVIDSFGLRSLSGMHSKGVLQIAGSGAYLVADAFQALALLSTHPRIEASRIAYLGFSMGGITAHYVIHERFRQSVLEGSPLRFAAAIAHYPSCHYGFVENTASTVPLFFFLAEKDDWTPALACQEYSALLVTRGYKVTTKIYEGAGHGYDEDIAARYQPDSSSNASCNPLLVNLDDAVLAPKFLRGGTALAPGADARSAGIAVYKWVSSCESKGATLGVSVGAGDRRQDAVHDTIKALQSVFGGA